MFCEFPISSLQHVSRSMWLLESSSALERGRRVRLGRCLGKLGRRGRARETTKHTSTLLLYMDLPSLSHHGSVEVVFCAAPRLQGDIGACILPCTALLQFVRKRAASGRGRNRRVLLLSLRARSSLKL